MKKFKIVSVILFAIALAFSGCSKDDTNDEQNSKASVSAEVVMSKIPKNLAETSPETSSLVQYMISNMVLAEGFTESRPSSGKTSGRTSGDTWTYGEYTISYTEDSNSTQNLFTYTVKENDKLVYRISGWINKNNSAGHWDFSLLYGFDGDNLGDSFDIDFDWTKNSSNDFYLDMVFDYGNETERLEANIFNNGSGNLKSYSGTTLEYKSTWNADGSGTSIDYTETPPVTTTF